MRKKKKLFIAPLVLTLGLSPLLSTSMSTVEVYGAENPTYSTPDDIYLTANKEPKYVFYFIGDGMGASHRDLAEQYSKWKLEDNEYKLAMNSLPVNFNISTDSLTSIVTDSAAAGTALATGIKTDRDVISMNGEGTESYTTILEAAQEKGMGTGLVTTVTITHATPASFGAHAASRSEESEIAEQYLNAEYDYMAGGGYQFFESAENGGKREEGDSLIPKFEELGYEVDKSMENYEDTDFSTVESYLGIYEKSYLTDEITQKNTERTSPTLAQMVENGIEVLSKDEDGFFMMVEGGYIDGAAHSNDTPTVLHETLAFDDSVQVALDFYEEHPDETLIIVTADHETGGLAIGYNQYGADFAPLDEITVSFGKAIEPYLLANDLDGFYNAIEENWHVTLTEEDKADIQNRINGVDLQVAFGMDEMTAKQYESMKHMLGFGGYATAPILAEKTRIGWATQTHTSEPVPTSVIGAGSYNFIGCTDNTDIPKVLAELLDVEIGIVE